MEINNKQENANKTPLENLSKEDLVKKCKNFLALAQKAKQTKDSLTIECNELKQKLNNVVHKNEEESKASTLLIENLTQQKLNLFITVEELKNKHLESDKKLETCQSELKETAAKLVNLDNENQSHVRQVKRLTDENEELITHLDRLENDIQELKRVTINDSASENCLEEKNSKIIELQSMLACSLEEVKKLQEHVGGLNDEVKSHKIIVSVKEKTISELEGKCKKFDDDLQQKKKVIDRSTNEMDDLNTELHKNRAIIEKLHRDVSDTRSKLNENQITGSQVTGDLENTNEKLKTKLKSYRLKIIKIAGDIKVLKQTKENLLSTIGESTEQVQTWKDQLTMFNNLLVKEINKSVEEKQRLLNELNEVKQFLDSAQSEKEQMSVHLVEMQSKLIIYEKQSTDMKEYIAQTNSLQKEKQQLVSELQETKSEVDKLNQINMQLNDRFTENKQETVEQFQSLKNASLELEEKLHAVLQEKEKNQTELMSSKLLLTELEKKNFELSEEIVVEKNRCKEVIQEKQDLHLKLTDLKNILQLKEEELLTLQQNLEKSDSENVKQNEERFQSLKNASLELEEKLQAVQREKEDKATELMNSKSLLAEMEKKNVELTEQVHTEKQRLEEANQEKVRCEKNVHDLTEQLTDLKNTLQSKQEESHSVQETVKSLNVEVEVYKDKIKELSLKRQESSEESDKELKKLQQDLADLTAQLKTSKRENGELLAEMNEMNEVLKERGETISKQQQYCENILNKVEAYEKQLSEANKHAEVLTEKDNKIKELELEMQNMKENQSAGDTDSHSGSLTERDDRIKELEVELNNLKEKFSQIEAHESSYAESECMSTSTISRMDESTRLKDLEGSWEERYGKLRTLALKLKGKVKEQTVQLNQEQNEKTELQNKLVTVTKNMQLLQAQSDDIQDKLESSKAESKKLMQQLESSAQDLSTGKNILASNDETICALQAELDNLKLEKKTMENSNKNLLSQIQSLKGEIEASVVLKREFESKIGKLEKDVLSRDKTINEEVEKHKATKAQMQELSKECKSKSVLNLEMQDYERSLKDLTQKLEKRQELVIDLQSTVDSQERTIAILREEVRVLEDRVLNEESDLTNSRTEISSVKKRLSDTEAMISQKDNRIHEIMQSLEICRGENEVINAQLAKVIADNQKICETIKGEKEEYKIQVLNLEQTVNELKDSLTIRNEELDGLRKDYEGYKIRAQSVLRQNQTRDVGTEERLNEEVANLIGNISTLKEQLEDLRTKFSDATSMNATLTEEKDRVSNSLEDVSIQLETHKRNYAELEMRYQQVISDNAEAVRSLKVHADTLAQCYRQQLSEQEMLHSDELKELRALLERNVLPAEENPYTPPPMRREEGEGSESVESTNSSSTSILNPLEKLLNSSGDVDVELAGAKQQLVQHEARLKHLTGLLSDTEQDLAKHVQMNQLLKEEIRRQQRSVEREKHAENLEYLKNVVFKFITLGNGDERNRLIPVLNTILKLSPEETQKLNTVVNGDPNNRGWGSYLPTWSSPKPL